MTRKETLDEPLPRPSIAYVDEMQDERDNFYGDAYESNLFEKIHLVHPKPNLNELVNDLIELRIDALVTDFNLSEAAPLSYNGEQLVSAFLAARSDFPCFIRTSFDDAALHSSDDVNRVYSKNVANEEIAGRNLFKRIALQIEHHRRRSKEWQDELQSLLEKDPAQRTIADVDRIVELDSKIEASLAKDMAISERVKKGLFDKESKLIEETERLIAEIKNALGE